MHKPLTPEDRALSLPGKPITGIPIRLADGRDWLIPRMGNADGAGQIRDELYGQISYRGNVDLRLLRLALFLALPFNYELTEGEFALLVDGTGGYRFDEAYDHHQPLRAIIGAYLPSQEDCEFGYDDWVRSSLLINNIDPGAVNPDDLPSVLAQLVQLGRCVPESRFIASAVQGESLAQARAIARAQESARRAADGVEAADE